LNVYKKKEHNKYKLIFFSRLLTTSTNTITTNECTYQHNH